jgi:hypothetical protein
VRVYVRCPKHGAVYDDNTACPACLREAAGGALRAKRKAPVGAILLVLVLAAAAGLGGWWWRERSKEQAARSAALARAEHAAAALAARVAPETELELIRRARRLAQALDRLLSANRRTILGFAEGPVDTAATTRVEARRAQQYLAYVRRIEQQLAAASPERPSNWGARSEEVRAVTNYLSATISQFRDALPPDRVPPRAERVRALDSARGYIEAAETALSGLPR